MITGDHVRELLRSGAERPVLVILEGRALVVPAAELRAGAHAGAYEVIARDGLPAGLGPDTPGRELDELASRLDAAVAEQGG
ncbi:hypothetical protein GCM10009716_19640 [Streptomyces sodiiphilus]|uniref:Prevent-host-death family protein n=1 Tax=Streptomyces sodiiphilus TaxID=226217 RepID=A0ABN2P1M1_9ACTN